MAVSKKLTRNIILGLLVLALVLSILAGLRVKDSLDSQLPVFGRLPELITVEDRLYSREGCAVPANVENCDIKPLCYTPTYLTSKPDRPFKRVGSTSRPGFPSLAVFSGPIPVD